MATKKRLKANAVDAPQTREQVQSFIKQLGDNQRKMARVETAMNDKIAVITDEYKPVLNELKDKIKSDLNAIQIWAEANRDDLTDGKKSINLVTGTIGWRQRPPSVSLSKVAVVLESLKTLKLTKFIRQKDEVNKEAMLADIETASTVKGVTIKTGIEDFYVEPFEQDAD